MIKDFIIGESINKVIDKFQSLLGHEDQSSMKSFVKEIGAFTASKDVLVGEKIIKDIDTNFRSVVVDMTSPKFLKNWKNEDVIIELSMFNYAKNGNFFYRLMIPKTFIFAGDSVKRKEYNNVINGSGGLDGIKFLKRSFGSVKSIKLNRSKVIVNYFSDVLNMDIKIKVPEVNKNIGESFIEHSYVNDDYMVISQGTYTACMNDSEACNIAKTDLVYFRLSDVFNFYDLKVNLLSSKIVPLTKLDGSIGTIDINLVSEEGFTSSRRFTPNLFGRLIAKYFSNNYANLSNLGLFSYLFDSDNTAKTDEKMVLLFGLTQSGKSTFLKINKDLINIAIKDAKPQFINGSQDNIEEFKKNIEFGYHNDKTDDIFIKVGEPEVDKFDHSTTFRFEGSLTDWTIINHIMLTNLDKNIMVDSLRTLAKLTSYNLTVLGTTQEIINYMSALAEAFKMVTGSLIMTFNPVAGRANMAQYEVLLDTMRSGIDTVFSFPFPTSQSIVKINQEDAKAITIFYEKFSRKGLNQKTSSIKIAIDPVTKKYEFISLGDSRSNDFDFSYNNPKPSSNMTPQSTGDFNNNSKFISN